MSTIHLLCIFLSLLIPIFLIADIKTIYNIQEVQEAITEESLILVDITNTLIYPLEPMLARHRGRNDFMAETAAMNQNEMEKLATLINVQTRWTLVESDTLEFISFLKNQHAAAIAITGSGRIPHLCKIPYVPELLPDQELPANPVDYYVKTLRNFSIDFSNFIPPSEEISRVCKKLGCIYENGILFLCHQSMGDVIPTFFEYLPRKFSKVIAIDDEIFYLRHLEKTLTEKNIPFEGFLYLAAQRFDEEYDPFIARIQLEYLLQNKVLLTDEEVLELK